MFLKNYNSTQSKHEEIIISVNKSVVQHITFNYNYSKIEYESQQQQVSSGDINIVDFSDSSMLLKCCEEVKYKEILV